MLSPKIPTLYFLQVWRRGSVGSQLLMLSPEMLKSQIHIFTRVNGWWSTFDAESKNAKKSQIHIFTGVERGRVGGQLLMLSPVMLKFQIHIFTGGRGHQQPTFDAKSINAKILTSLFCRWGGLVANF